MHFRNLTLDPVVVEASAPLSEVAEALTRCGGGRHLPVLDGGRLLGVVTRESVDDQGVLRDGVWLGWGKAQVARDLVTIVPQVGAHGLDEALDALLDHPCALIVDDEGGLLGLMTEHDGVRIALDQCPPDQSARSIASAPVRTVDADELACKAARQMDWHHTRHLVIVDEGQPLGVVSERDLVAEGVDQGRQLTVREVWRERPFVSVPEDALLVDVAQQMLDEHIGCVPLVDGAGRPVAILSRRDLVRFALGSRSERGALG